MEPHAKLWVEQDGKLVLSDYRVRLLALIDETGSLGGRRQSTPENANTAIPAGSFFNSQILERFRPPCAPGGRHQSLRGANGGSDGCAASAMNSFGARRNSTKFPSSPAGW